MASTLTVPVSVMSPACSVSVVPRRRPVTACGPSAVVDGACAATCGGVHVAAVARAEIHHHVGGGDPRQVEHALDQFRRRRHPHDVLAAQAELRLKGPGLRSGRAGPEQRQQGQQRQQARHRPALVSSTMNSTTFRRSRVALPTFAQLAWSLPSLDRIA